NSRRDQVRAGTEKSAVAEGLQLGGNAGATPVRRGSEAPASRTHTCLVIESRTELCLARVARVVCGEQRRRSESDDQRDRKILPRADNAGGQPRGNASPPKRRERRTASEGARSSLRPAQSPRLGEACMPQGVQFQKSYAAK